MKENQISLLLAEGDIFDAPKRGNAPAIAGHSAAQPGTKESGFGHGINTLSALHSDPPSVCPSELGGPAPPPPLQCLLAALRQYIPAHYCLPPPRLPTAPSRMALPAATTPPAPPYGRGASRASQSRRSLLEQPFLSLTPPATSTSPPDHRTTARLKSRAHIRPRDVAPHAALADAHDGTCRPPPSPSQPRARVLDKMTLRLPAQVELASVLLFQTDPPPSCELRHPGSTARGPAPI